MSWKYFVFVLFCFVLSHMMESLLVKILELNWKEKTYRTVKINRSFSCGTIASRLKKKG